MKKNSKNGKAKKDPRLEEIKKQQEQLSPEEKLFNVDEFTKQSDEFADKEARKRKERSALKSWFVNLSDNDIDFLFSNIIEKYESKFKKSWFYMLADLYKVDRKLMDPYIKPEFVRLFIIYFVYARFPRRVLSRLRGRNRKAYRDGHSNIKLFQHLTGDVSEQLDSIIKQVYVMMGECVANDEGIKEFKNKYCNEYKVWFQTEINF